MKNVCVYTQQSMSHIVINTDVILTVNLNDLMGIGGEGRDSVSVYWAKLYLVRKLV